MSDAGTDPPLEVPGDAVADERELTKYLRFISGG